MNREGPHQERQPVDHLDLHFADWMVRLSGGVGADLREDLRMAAILASNAVRRGHICAPLFEWAGKPIENAEALHIESRQYPELGDWVLRLKGLSVVGAPGEFKPLILDEKHRLYLQRYWKYEGELAAALVERAGGPKRMIDSELLKGGLRRLFTGDEGDEVDWQQIAALAALLNSLTIISGGPGTGKTFTTAKILALMLELAQPRSLAVALAAPTGKAAARLQAVIRQSKAGLNCSTQLKELIPDKTSTIHRLLGSTRGRGFRFNKDNPLPYDVVVIDEASMVDLPLMAKLTGALKADARLILLGDKEQLASVEPGAVFGDICEAAGADTFSPEFRKQAARLIGGRLPERATDDAGLPDAAVMLKRNYRFGTASGICTLADLIKAGEGESALEVLKGGKFGDISWQNVPSAVELPGALERNTMEHDSRSLQTDNPVDAFTLFDKFHILCALREGPYGVVSVNRMIQEFCARKRLIRREGRWYRGEPVLVTVNDYQLKLFNGDLGIFLEDPDTASLRVFFRAEEGAFRKVLPARLGAYETAHAITVHKSQGSEFEDILLLLPDRHSEVVNRELIYTAVTRAKARVEIWGRDEVFIEAISRRTRRISGLTDRLKIAAN